MPQSIVGTVFIIFTAPTSWICNTSLCWFTQAFVNFLQVLYHQKNFISGSMDGLINVADFSDVGLNEDDSFKVTHHATSAVLMRTVVGVEET